jgi:hypothetical protein
LNFGGAVLCRTTWCASFKKKGKDTMDYNAMMMEAQSLRNQAAIMAALTVLVGRVESGAKKETMSLLVERIRETAQLLDE